MSWAVAQVHPHVALRGRFRAVWAIFARVSNRLFYPISRLPLVARPGALWPAAISQNKTYRLSLSWLIPAFFCMTSCINFSGFAASCVPRALLRLHLLPPDLPLRPPTPSPLTHSLVSPSSSAALLPRPSVSLLFCFHIRTAVHCPTQPSLSSSTALAPRPSTPTCVIRLRRQPSPSSSVALWPRPSTIQPAFFRMLLP
jgi:hypothetical protein